MSTTCTKSSRRSKRKPKRHSRLRKRSRGNSSMLSLPHRFRLLRIKPLKLFFNQSRIILYADFKIAVDRATTQTENGHMLTDEAKQRIFSEVAANILKQNKTRKLQKSRSRSSSRESGEVSGNEQSTKHKRYQKHSSSRSDYKARH